MATSKKSTMQPTKTKAETEPEPTKPLPVRLDLFPADHERLERVARDRGLGKAAYARQAVLERIKVDEGNK